MDQLVYPLIESIPSKCFSISIVISIVFLSLKQTGLSLPMLYF